ncbi:MAG: TetR family transcriptional regulator [Coriobacteriia bacterium]|nr:TetR family transcriptional regulator [Coriobacteriia bacterium]
MTAKRAVPLTKAEILSAALALIDAEGIDALTMRRLAHELGVEAMSLYHHVPNKDALLDGVVELALAAQAPTAPPPSGDWKATVIAAVCGFRRALITHPNVLPHMITHPPSSPEASAMYIDGPLAYLVNHRVSDKDAAELFEAFFALSFGHALLTTNYSTIEGDGVPTVEFTEESFKRAVRTLMDGYTLGV